MTKIAFIGLGNMGAPMAKNLLKAGHEVTGFDLNETAVIDLCALGATGAVSVSDAVSDVDTVITMLPNGAIVKAIYGGDDGKVGDGWDIKFFFTSFTARSCDRIGYNIFRFFFFDLYNF